MSKIHRTEGIPLYLLRLILVELRLAIQLQLCLHSNIMSITTLNLLRSRITWKKGLWACLWRITQISVIEVGRFYHYVWQHSLVWNYCITWRKWTKHQHSSHSASWLEMWCNQLQTPSSMISPPLLCQCLIAASTCCCHESIHRIRANV